MMVSSSTEYVLCEGVDKHDALEILNKAPYHGEYKSRG